MAFACSPSVFILIGLTGSSSPATLSAVKAVVEMDGIILESIKQTMELVNNHEQKYARETFP